jgi:DNA-binding GntR family transcriptional regulator
MADQPPRANQIHLALRQAIIEQALEPGAKLPEDAIGEQFNVSRTVVRRALELLAAEELVEIRPNRGAVVASPTLDQANDLFSVRIDIERVVARRVCGSLSKDQIARLNRHIASEEHALRDNRPEYIRLAAQFHVLLAEMCASPLLLRYVTQMIWRSALVLRLHGRPRWHDCNVQEHIDLVAALEAGDKAKTDRLLTTHLESVLTRALEGATIEGEQSLGEILSRYSATSAKRELRSGGSRRRTSSQQRPEATTSRARLMR